MRSSIREPLDAEGLVASVISCFKSGASAKNPGFVKIHSTIDVSSLSSLFSARHVKNGIVTMKMKSDFGLVDMLQNELHLVSINGLAQFSFLAHPELLSSSSWTCNPLDTEQKEVPKGAFNGIALTQSSLGYCLTDNSGSKWILNWTEDGPYIYRKDQRSTQLDPLAALGYRVPEYLPRIVSNPENVIVLPLEIMYVESCESIVQYHQTDE
jgi:hypothetical protein